jgi:hypothetical protein
MTALTLPQLATVLVGNSFNSLTAQQKIDFRDTLAPKVTGFDGQQRAWFGDWWLLCTQAQVDAMNAALPPNTRVWAVTYLGNMYLNIDLGTDATNLGDTYFATRTTLRALVFTNIPNLASLLP